MSATNVPVESLELIRNRLNQVYLLLRKMADQLHHLNRNPRAKMPGFSSLSSQLQTLVTQLQTIAAQLDANADILRLSNAFPLPEFSTTQHEGLVTTLLRKKPLPEVDEWIDAAIAESEKFDDVPLEKEDEFAEWCHSKVKELEAQYQFDGFQEAAEIQKQETEEGKAEQEREKAATEERESRIRKIEGTAKPLLPELVLKFMSRGILDV